MKHNGILLEITLALLRIRKKDFSEKIEVPPSLFSRYLSEERFSDKRIQTITNALSLPPNYFDTHLPSIEQLMLNGNDNQALLPDNNTSLLQIISSQEQAIKALEETVRTQASLITCLQNKDKIVI